MTLALLFIASTTPFVIGTSKYARIPSSCFLTIRAKSFIGLNLEWVANQHQCLKKLFASDRIGEFHKSRNCSFRTYARKVFNRRFVKSYGKIDENDKTFLGSPLPDFTYGFNLFLKYKIVDFTMFFQGVQGNKIFNVQRYWMDAFHYGGARPSATVFSNDNNLSPDVSANSWTPTNQDAKYPVIKTQVDNNNNYRASDFYIEDGSYLRLKNVQVGVNLPQELCTFMKMSRFRLYASVYNLLTFTKYSGMDPEIGNQVNTGTVGNASTTTNNTSMGIDLGTFPQARTYTFGLLVDF
jgi:hypothetical protein